MPMLRTVCLAVRIKLHSVRIKFRWRRYRWSQSLRIIFQLTSWWSCLPASPARVVFQSKYWEARFLILSSGYHKTPVVYPLPFKAFYPWSFKNLSTFNWVQIYSFVGRLIYSHEWRDVNLNRQNIKSADGEPWTLAKSYLYFSLPRLPCSKISANSQTSFV